MILVSAMVTDKTQDKRFNVAVYRVKELLNHEMALVVYVGDIVNGRLVSYGRQRDETYRKIVNLVKWRE